MSASSSSFPWPPYYGHFQFFEKRMQQHSQVTSLKAHGGGVYDLALRLGDPLRLFICECYSFGAAEYIETIGNLGELDAIVINSAWCGYTSEAKKLCRNEQVGLFKIGDFMAALNKPKIWSYLNETEKDAFEKKGWL
jgi:hypothetical protein